ncbi:MAG: hypothetical protein IPG89_09620 [Bacteroidetes bacterium]|nr:hypothetical protein [Bacteroidota bacterium]
MYCINDKQIDYILNDIRARGVEMEDLQYNLLDHICCLVEQNLEENGDFEGFYKKTIPKFYKHELWEIEEETITLLTFKNYYTMKKIMLVSGTISAAFLSVGILFKFMHWPGASMGIVLGITIASFLFLPLLFTLKMREKQQSKDKLILGIGMLSAIAMSLGIMFKIMHWPGANMMGLGSILAMVFVFLPIYFFSGIRNPETKVNTIVSSLVIILGSGLFFTLINTRPSATIERTNVLANQHTQNSYEYILKQNSLSYEIVSKDSTLKQEELNKLRTTCTNLCNSIEDLKLKLVSASEGIEIKKIDFNTMYGGGDYGAPTMILFDDNGNAKGDLKQLRKNLSDFNSLVSQTYGQKTESLINLGNQLNANDEMVSWEISNFYFTPISIVLRNLTQIQLDVLNIEANCYAVSR